MDRAGADRTGQPIETLRHTQVHYGVTPFLLFNSWTRQFTLSARSLVCYAIPPEVDDQIDGNQQVISTLECK